MIVPAGRSRELDPREINSSKPNAISIPSTEPKDSSFRHTLSCRSHRNERHASPSSSGVTTTGAIEHAGFACIQPKDRKSVVSGKSVSVRVDLGGRRIIKKKKNQ